MAYEPPPPLQQLDLVVRLVRHSRRTFSPSPTYTPPRVDLVSPGNALNIQYLIVWPTTGLILNGQ